MRELYTVPGAAGTVKRRQYIMNYWGIKRLDPTGIIPKGAPVDYTNVTVVRGSRLN